MLHQAHFDTKGRLQTFAASNTNDRSGANGHLAELQSRIYWPQAVIQEDPPFAVLQSSVYRPLIPHNRSWLSMTKSSGQAPVRDIF